MDYKQHQHTCAVALGEDVFKIENYPEWLKSNNNKDIIILEDCNKDQLEDKYLYWEHTINYKKYADTEVQTGTKKFRPRRRSV